MKQKGNIKKLKNNLKFTQNKLKTVWIIIRYLKKNTNSNRNNIKPKDYYFKPKTKKRKN